MYAANELMFPSYVIPLLRNMRGPEWDALVERVTGLPETHDERLAFMLMMIRLNGCMVCETDSYRAMRGCGACSKQTMRRYKGADQDLMRAYQQALEDVQRYLERQRPAIGRVA
jgi:hypothetical protein